MELLLDNERLTVDALRVSALPPKERLNDPWAQALLRQPGARRFLTKQSSLPSHTAQVVFVAMAAGCILNADVSVAIPMPVTGQKAGKIRAAARKLDEEVSNVATLNFIVTEATFRTGLQHLSNFYPPRNIPVRTLKGNPERRQFIWAVAKAFYSHFHEFHVQAITEIVALIWPTADERNVRHELTPERKGEIAEAAKAESSASGHAAIEATAILNRAQRRSGLGKEDSEVPHVSDSQKIKEALAALKGLGDKELAASLVQGLQSILVDFDFELLDS